MKAKINYKKGSRRAWSPYNLTIKSLILSAFILTGFQALQAQDQYTKPSWWFGVAGGSNFNFYRGTTQELNSNLTVPAAFHHGNGAGLYVAPLVEFHRPDSRLGAMLQVGYDNRSAELKTVRTPCNCPADLTINLSYITIEPSLRFAPFKSNFYLFGGPRLAFNLEKTYSYKQQVSPDFSEQLAIPREKGDLSSINKTLISMQIGAGYDIPLSSQNRRTQFVLSPFVSYQPYFGQSPRSIETWTVTTFRVGAALKLGRGHKISAPPAAAVLVRDVKFSVNSPKNIPGERRVRETFPVRNYVFFDLGSTAIPDRYVLLTKNQVKDFKEDQLEVFKPKRLSGRSDRQMTVYYNILNILGDRMGKNPSVTVRLAGASMEGQADGLAMAESIKQYLVGVFGIDPSRIITEGRIKPRIPSEQPGGTKELVLLREGDRRVSIWSESPGIMMEFQSGSDTPLKPVEILSMQEAPLDSYITFNVEGGKDAFTSWSLEIKDEKGTVQNFGPYTKETMRIAGKTILGARAEGDYKVTMIGQTQNGSTVKKETSVHMVLWTPSKREEGMRFSIIYEFNESKSIMVYEKYLTDIVTPKIPKDGTVIIKGYTDVIGDVTHNKELSISRANDVRKILENSLAKAGKTDVKFEVYGFGEDQKESPFNNDFPEERFYNRTVVIDIIPNK
jgi:outer membrane protein OmpA-like peptidoglycan-associated protein